MMWSGLAGWQSAPRTSYSDINIDPTQLVQYSLCPGRAVQLSHTHTLIHYIEPMLSQSLEPNDSIEVVRADRQ